LRHGVDYLMLLKDFFTYVVVDKLSIFASYLHKAELSLSSSFLLLLAQRQREDLL
jgi:hypothetical protein